MSENTLTPDSATVHLADKLETEVDAIFRRGDDLPTTREAVMKLMKHFTDMLSEHERERDASEKRVEHLSSLIRQAVLPFGEADYPRYEKVAALKLAFRNLVPSDFDEEVPF